MKGHNYRKVPCNKCGKIHTHPKGMLGKKNPIRAELNPFFGKHHSEESKVKMREKGKKRIGENSNRYGKHLSEESKQKIREKKIGKKLDKNHLAKLREYWDNHSQIKNEEADFIRENLNKFSDREIAFKLNKKSNQVTYMRKKLGLKKDRGSVIRNQFSSGRRVYSYSLENLQKRLKGLLKRPTKPEEVISELIKENNLPFVYTGNGSVIIGGFNPDFLSEELKKIIEVNGVYWHNLPEIKLKDKRKYVVYGKNGYQTLILWEDEIKKNKELCLNKIRVFTNGNQRK